MGTLGTTAIEVAAIFALALLNGVLAMSETAMVSSRSARLRGRAESGDEGAKVALELVAEPNRFLSTVQIGITLVGVLAGALGGATLAGTLGDALSGVPVVGPYAQTVAFVVVVVAISYLSLILGELVPKRLALAASESIASLVARPMRLISRLAGPAVWFLGVSTDAVLRLLRLSPVSESAVTEQEIGVLLAEGVRAGTLERAEGELATRALRLDDTPIRSVMTPRPDILWLDAEGSPEDHWRTVVRSGHSYLPVGRGGLDDLLGLAPVKPALARLVLRASEGETTGVIEGLDELESPPFVSEGAPVSALVELFSRPGPRVAIVVDERGHLEGLATPTDVLEALVGEFPEDGSRPGLVRREDGSYLVDGSLAARELKERLKLPKLPREEDYETVGGFVLAYLGRLPEAGERFEWEGYGFEVVDLDGYRIDKVILTPPDETP